ncbi:MAG: efflux RND transporter periplasmic adaptor subunit [Myxococcota bacterium]|nr:efflux RND transporter periplasmic adaptor subunit [Myxococcota bacterium]
MSRKKILLPIIVILVACLVAFVVLATAPEVKRGTPEALLPAIRVMTPSPQDVLLKIRSQGTVMPRTESTLVPEVSGPVIWVSPALASGGFFEADEPLLRIDARDYQTAVARARAEVARAEGESEHASSELKRQEGLARKNATSSSHLSAANRAARVASANLEASWAALYQAERDLERCVLRAPFKGRVREENVDIGQFISRGMPVATLYATDFAEIRLPLADEELAFLDLNQLDSNPDSGPEVKLHARFAGEPHTWRGRLVRTEGEIDSRSRMIHVVARVEDPYGRNSSEAEGDADSPLAVGLFVQADITGNLAEEVLVVPRSALRDGEKLVVIDAEDRLHLREVEILRIDQEDVILRTPLHAGERIGTSSLQWVVEGMQVIPVSENEGVRS